MLTKDILFFCEPIRLFFFILFITFSSDKTLCLRLECVIF